MTKSTSVRPKGEAATLINGPPKVQDCDEYIVIQQIIWNGKDSGWRVWGHTKPTDIDRVYSDPYFAPGLSTLERIEAIKNMGQK